MRTKGGLRRVCLGSVMGWEGVSIDGLIAVGDVEEEVLLVMVLIEGSHRRTGRRDHVIHEEEERVFGTQMDALSDQEIELSDSQVRWHQILLLIQVSDARLRGLLDDHGHSVRILLADLLALSPPLLKRMLLFVRKLHVRSLQRIQWPNKCLIICDTNASLDQRLPTQCLQ